MVWLRNAASITLCAGVTLLPAVPLRAEDSAEALYRTLFSPPNEGVAGLKCTGRLALLEGVVRPVKIPVEWTVHADPFSFQFRALQEQEERHPAPWWTWQCADGQLRGSWAGRDTNQDQSAGLDERPWEWRNPPMEVTPPKVAGWCQGMTALTNQPPDQVRFAESDNGKDHPVVESLWLRPLTKYLGWTVVRAVVDVDGAKRLPGRVRWYDDQGHAVSETTYAEPKQLPSGRWVWLRWETTIQSPTIHVGGKGTLTKKTGEGVDREMRVEPTLAWPKRIVRRTFRVTDEGLVVPSRVQVCTLAGIAIDLVVEKVERLP